MSNARNLSKLRPSAAGLIQADDLEGVLSPVSSVNGQTGDVVVSAPVSSVNGQAHPIIPPTIILNYIIKT